MIWTYPYAMINVNSDWDDTILQGLNESSQAMKQAVDFLSTYNI